MCKAAPNAHVRQHERRDSMSGAHQSVRVHVSRISGKTSMFTLSMPKTGASVPKIEMTTCRGSCTVGHAALWPHADKLESPLRAFPPYRPTPPHPLQVSP